MPKTSDAIAGRFDRPAPEPQRAGFVADSPDPSSMTRIMSRSALEPASTMR
jgi:hypothetical protein